MAQEPNLGDVFGNLNQAIDATKGKAAEAVRGLEKMADEREAAIREAESKADQAAARELDRGKRTKLVRDEGARAAERQVASVEDSEVALARETGALDASTAALERNAAARAAAATAAERQAAVTARTAAYGVSTPVPRSGGEAYTYNKRLDELAAANRARDAPRKPFGSTAYVPLGQRDPVRQRQLYVEEFGAEAAERARLEPYPGVPLSEKPVLTGTVGGTSISTNEPLKNNALARGAAKARREEAKRLREEATAAAKEEAVAAEEVAAVPAIEPTAVPAIGEPGSIRPKLTPAQERLLRDLPSPGGVRDPRREGSNKRPLERLRDLGLIENKLDRQGYFHTAEGASFAEDLGGTARLRDLKAPPNGGYGILAAERLAYEEEARRQAAAAAAVTPEPAVAAPPPRAPTPTGEAEREAAERRRARVAAQQAENRSQDAANARVVADRRREANAALAAAQGRATPELAPAPDLGAVRGDLGPAIAATRGPIPAYAFSGTENYAGATLAAARAKQRAEVVPPLALPTPDYEKQIAEAQAAAAREEAIQKELHASLLSDQAAYLAQSNALREASSKRGVENYLSTGAFGGGYGGGPPRPPVALGGAGGAGGGEFDSAVARDAELQARLNVLRTESNDLVQQSVGVYASSSTQLQRHGALTQEFIQALARGEVTLKEFESQLVTTIGKFAGWAVAGGLVYGAYEAIKKLADGVVNTQSGVEQLKRSLGEKVNVPAAEEGFRKLSKEVNVPIPVAAEAQFFSARVFRDQAESLELASTALKAYKLDQVSVQDAVKSFGAVAVAFRVGPQQIAETFDQLDVGQLKFNARLNQTLPQMGRAAASWAAAGGSLKGLGDALIEINRATGGGGGTGGGNPATALLREPANLTRPESEQTLRKYGFDPREARSNIQAFDESVQRQAKEGKLDEQALQALSKAAGAGAGIGYRYFLPYFRLGRTSLPEDVTSATAAGAGSAADDLSHKLAQADQQLEKIGIDFELFGSHLGSGGIQRTFTDFLTVINQLITAGAGAVDPFAKLTGALTNLPGVVRIPAEALGAGLALRAVSRSRIGQSAADLVGESGLYLKTQADPEAARVARSVAVAQREEDRLLQQELSERAHRGRGVLRGRTEAAQEAVEATRLSPAAVEALPAEERTKYEAAIDSRLAALDAAYTAQVENARIITRLQARQIEIQEYLEASLSQQVAAIKARGLYGVGGQAPTTNALIAPNEDRAKAEFERRTGKAYPVIGGATQDATEAVTAEGAAAEAGALEATRLEAAAASAGALVQGFGTKIRGAAGALSNFRKNLGLLGKGIAVFAAADIVAQLTGAAGDVEHYASLSSQLANPTTAADLRKAVESTPKGGESPLEFVGHTAQDLLNFVPLVGHPIAALESVFGGPEHADLFPDVARRQAQEKAQQRARELDTGKLAFPGEAGADSAEALEAAHERGQEAVANLASDESKGGKQGQEALEGTLKQIRERVKLRLLQLQQFGGQFGLESIDYIFREQIAPLAEGYVSTGNQTDFEEWSSVSKEADKSILSSAKERADIYAKFAGVTGNAGELRSGLADSTAEVRRAIANIKKEAGEVNKAIIDAQLSFAKSNSQEQYELGKHASLTGGSPFGSLATPFFTEGAPSSDEAARKAEAQKKVARELSEQEAHGANVNKNNALRTKALKIGEAEIEGSAYEAAEAPGRAKAEAGAAGEGRLKAAEDKLLQDRKEEADAIKLYAKNHFNWKLLYDAEKKVAEDAAAAAEAELGKGEREGALKLSGIPRFDRAARSGQEVANAQAHQQAVNTVKGLTPSKRAELLSEAQAKTNDAVNAASESQANESKQLDELRGTLEETKDSYYPERVAADALRKAHALEAAALTPAEHLQAQIDAQKAIKDARKARFDEISSEGELAESRDPGTVAKDQQKLRTLKKQLPLASTRGEHLKLEAQINDERRKLSEDKASEVESQVKFLEHTDQITSAQTVERLQKVLRELKKAHATPQRIRQVEEEIFDAQQQNVKDFAVGAIKQAPTLYDAKTLSAARPGAPASAVAFSAIYHAPTLTQHNTIQISVTGEKGHFASEMTKVFTTLTRAQLRSAGLAR